MDTPIACTLRPDEYDPRVADLSAFAERALRSREPTARGERLTFDAGDENERRLRAVIAAEAECCAFLTIELQHDDDALVLDISGPEAARPIIAEMFG